MIKQRLNVFIFVLIVVTIIESFFWFIQRRFSFEYGSFEMRDLNKPTFIKYSLEYCFIKIAYSIIFWFISSKKIPDFSLFRCVFLFNMLFFAVFFVVSLLMYPISLIQLGNFRLQDIFYLKIFNLFSSLLASSIITPLVNRKIMHITQVQS